MNSRSEFVLMLLVLWQSFYYWVAMFSFGATFFYYGQPFANPFGAGLGGVGATSMFLGN